MRYEYLVDFRSGKININCDSNENRRVLDLNVNYEDFQKIIKIFDIINLVKRVYEEQYPGEVESSGLNDTGII